MKKIQFFLSALVCLSLMIQSCKKDEATSDNTSDQMTAQDMTAQNDMSEQVFDELEETLPTNFSDGGADDRSGCAVITYAQPQGTWPNVITVDYGTGCPQHHGLVFKGKLIVNQTDKMNVAGAVRVITFDNFYVENVKIEGSKTVTFTGLNAAGQPEFVITGNETLTFPGGQTATRNINHNRKMIEGYGTNPRADNVWSITIGDSGTNRNGNPYTVTTLTALTKRAVCPWIGAGVLQFVNNNKTRTLDFGDGTCNRDAVLTLPDGTEREIKIRRQWWK